MSDTSYKCPCCGTDMFAGGNAEVHMLGCNVCCGIFMDNRGCARLIEGSLPDDVRDQIRYTTLHAARKGDAPAGYRTRAAASDRACPICNTALAGYVCTRKTHGVDVHIDVCAEHGTWFDQGEAWALLQAVDLKRLELRIQIEERVRAELAEESTEAWSQFMELLVD